MRSIQKTWTFIAALVVLAGLSMVNAASRGANELAESAPAQELRKRRDIRELEKSPDDLKDLRHALFMLKKQEPKCGDPDAKSEYDCWAAYHNNFDKFGCRHASDLFWPWHRYHLVEFEKALRGSDPEHPERVRDVTLPFWNWTAAPSGKDFPASFEQEMLEPGEFYPEDCPNPANCRNPFWVGGRRENRTCQGVKAGCVSEALAVTSWRQFAGAPGQISDFEVQAHNFMHLHYIAGPMRNASTAAQDPIYWLFHAYIDNVWDQWQRRHQKDPCLAANVPNPLRPLAVGDWPPADVTFQNVLCTRELGYEYVQPEAPIAADLPSCPPRGAMCVTGTEETPVPLTSGEIPASFDTAEIRLSGVTVPERFSYDAWVLLHPASELYQPPDRSFLDEWIATSFVAWRTGGHVHPGASASTASSTMDVQLDVTSTLKKVAGLQSTDAIAATVVFSPSNKAERAARLNFGSDVNFRSATLLITRAGVVTEIPLERK